MKKLRIRGGFFFAFFLTAKSFGDVITGSQRESRKIISDSVGNS